MAVKSAKTHMRRILGDTKLNFEEMSTTLAQVEACMNSRLLAASTPNEEGIEPLMPGRFLAGRPLCPLPDQPPKYSDMTSPKRWKRSPVVYFCYSFVFFISVKLPLLYCLT